MRLETVCTGDELLTGLTADTNSRFFQARALEQLGEQVLRSTVVGDRKADIVAALREAGARADAVLVSGGLGPTLDDLTAEAAAEAAGVGLTEDAGAKAHLVERFKARGVVLTPNNLRQARVPVGARVVVNSAGSAPGFELTIGQARCYFVPGVPSEYRHLVETFVIPSLRALAGPARTHRVLRLLKTVLLPESHLDAKVVPLVLRHPEVEFGTRTHAPENHLKLLARGPTAQAAQAALAAAERDCRDLLGEAVFGADDETLESVLAQALTLRAETLAVAESCTAGLVMGQLSRVPGASSWLFGGVAAYDNRAKELWLDVPHALLEQHGAVSEEVARAMASGVRAKAKTAWGLAVTGIAGPTGGTAAKPVGTVFLAAAGPGGAVQVERHLFGGDRDRVRQFSVGAALDLLRRSLLHSAPSSP